MSDLASRILARIGQWLPNSDLTVPFEFMTVFDAVNGIWDALPFVVRVSLTGGFLVLTVFTILRMLF